MAQKQLEALTAIETEIFCDPTIDADTRRFAGFLFSVAALPQEDLREIFDPELRSRVEQMRSE